jgi:hypothetical protein
VPEARRGKFDIGDVWTWVALDPDTKLVSVTASVTCIQVGQEIATVIERIDE